MLKCNNCGKVIEDDDLGYHTEPHGEILPNECFCGGNYEIAYPCKCCGDYFIEEELTNGYCNECLESEMTFENAEKFGEEKGEINLFYQCLLNNNEINEIIKSFFKEYKISQDNKIAKIFCRDNLYEFTKWLEKEIW